jgi:hypothetical protein
MSNLGKTDRSTITREQIQNRAYEIYLSRGGENGKRTGSPPNVNCLRSRMHLGIPRDGAYRFLRDRRLRGQRGNLNPRKSDARSQLWASAPHASWVREER